MKGDSFNGSMFQMARVTTFVGDYFSKQKQKYNLINAAVNLTLIVDVTTPGWINARTNGRIVEQNLKHRTFESLPLVISFPKATGIISN